MSKSTMTVIYFENVKCPVCYADCNIEFDVDYLTLNCKHEFEMCNRYYDTFNKMLKDIVKIGLEVKSNDIQYYLNRLRDQYEFEVTSKEKETKWSRKLKREIDIYYKIQQLQKAQQLLNQYQ